MFICERCGAGTPETCLCGRTPDYLAGALKRAKRMILRHGAIEKSWAADKAFDNWCREYVRILNECSRRAGQNR